MMYRFRPGQLHIPYLFLYFSLTCLYPHNHSTISIFLFLNYILITNLIDILVFNSRCNHSIPQSNDILVFPPLAFHHSNYT